jgi:hypothetical protein
VEALLQREQLASRPHVGVAYAQSDSGQTHEWSKLRAGLFSHVARSALLGAADVNLDGAVEYSELAAFTAAALGAIDALPGRLSVHTWPPPQNPRRPLATRRADQGLQLVLRPGDPLQRFWIEDDRGVRLADVNRSTQEPLVLALPRRDAYFVRADRGELRLDEDSLDGAAPALRLSELSERSASDDPLERAWFPTAFGRPFYDGYSASGGLVPVAFDGVSQLEVRSSLGAARALRGFELGLAASRAPAETWSAALGPYLAWRSNGEPWRFGARAYYAGAPRAWREDAALHRLGLQVLAGWEPRAALAPFVELGLGAHALIAAGSFGTQGDLFIPEARLTAGGRFSFQRLSIRAAAGALVELRGAQTGALVSPLLELGVELAR